MTESVYKIIELVGTSPTSWEEAARCAVERAAKYHNLCAQRAARRGLENVRLLRTTAEDLLYRLLTRGSVERFFVLFPDPWPKKRHHKRRLIHPGIATALSAALVPGGQLLVKTDHEPYAEVIASVLSAEPTLAPLEPDEAFRDLPMTGFEHKYLDQGRNIFAFACVRST